MLRKNFCIFYSCQFLISVLFTVFLINGCAIIDKIFFPPSPSPTDSASPSSQESPSLNPENAENGNNAENRNNDEQLDRLVRTRQCFPPNQTEYIYGNYKIGWTISGSRYEGLLNMEGRIGKMRIQYFNEETNKAETVDQIMVLASCTKGLVMLGFNPILADTNQKHPTYAADNLIFRRETNGDVTIMNYDDRGVTAPVEIEQVSN